MKFTKQYEKWFKALLPTPFIISILLTILVFSGSLLHSEKPLGDLLLDWQKGLWNSSLLAFAFQMMLMLVLGHALAITNSFHSFTNWIIKPIKTTAQAAYMVTFFTLIIAFLNWGLGLIFGAIITRKIGENFTERKLPLNYALIGACGYSGLMVWHGGISGSSLIKAAELNHIQDITHNVNLPAYISLEQTVFSYMNIATICSLLLCLPILAYIWGKSPIDNNTTKKNDQKKDKNPSKTIGLEYLETSRTISKIIGIGWLIVAVFHAFSAKTTFGFINPNYINFVLLGFNLLMHQNIRKFLKAINQAIAGSSGILIQFPIYFGILALMQSGGLVEYLSELFIKISTPDTLPIYTFFSAGIVNVFVPSGGGQWALQGPIILEAANQLGTPLPKIVLALAYGDQITNMLQPFWALPLLSITGLKARDILPYSLLFMVTGGCIFIGALLLF